MTASKKTAKRHLRLVSLPDDDATFLKELCEQEARDFVDYYRRISIEAGKALADKSRSFTEDERGALLSIRDRLGIFAEQVAANKRSDLISWKMFGHANYMAGVLGIGWDGGETSIQIRMKEIYKEQGSKGAKKIVERAQEWKTFARDAIISIRKIEHPEWSNKQVLEETQARLKERGITRSDSAVSKEIDDLREKGLIPRRTLKTPTKPTRSNKRGRPRK